MSQLNLDKFPEKEEKSLLYMLAQKRSISESNRRWRGSVLRQVQCRVDPRRTHETTKNGRKFKNRIALVHPKLEARPSLRRRSCGKEPSA